MAEKTDASSQQPETNPDEALKKKLLARIGVAATVIVALLGSLALVDLLNEPQRPPQKVATAVEPSEPAVKPAEAEPPKPEPKPDEKAEAKPEDKPAEAATGDKPAEKKDDTKAETKVAAAPAAATPEGTSAAGTAPRPPRPLTLPATARPAAARPTEPVIAAAPKRPDAASEIARTQPYSAPVARHAPASRPLTQAAERSRQFSVQMGVFSNVANAEELRAKLELAGIPAQIEARVLVGPFSTRQEADAAREKLRAMGLDEGMLVATKKP